MQTKPNADPSASTSFDKNFVELPYVNPTQPNKTTNLDHKFFICGRFGSSYKNHITNERLSIFLKTGQFESLSPPLAKIILLTMKAS